MSRILVTGGSGFIGLPVITELARRGEEVHAVSTRSSPPEVPGVHWHRLDLLGDEAAIEALMSVVAPVRLMHIAWYAEPGRLWHAPENVVWVERSLRLMRSFIRHGGRRMLMLGTCAEYDWSRAQSPLRESGTPLVPATMYGVSKDGLRRVAGRYAELEDLEFAWGRVFFLYGPREPQGRLVPALIRSVRDGTQLTIRGPDRVRDYMHVQDAARALVALLEGSVTGEVNIASGVGIEIATLVGEIEGVLGRGGAIRHEALPDEVIEPPRLVADVTRLSEEVGFEPQWELSAGLDETARWWSDRCR